MRATAYESWVDDNLVGIHTAEDKLCVTEDVGELLKFLRYSASQTIRVAWDMDEFIAPVLRRLPAEILDRLSKFDDHLTYQGHELYYLPERMFRVGKSRFYGIRDFWGAPSDEKPTLETVQKRAIELLNVLDAFGLKRPGGEPIRKLTSPIAVFEDSDWGKKVYDSVPKGYNLPQNCWEMLEYASRADGKDWVSNHYVGHFNQGEVYDYDISACYPSIARHLPDIREMTVWKSRKLETRELKARLGVVRGQFTLDPAAEHAHCSPIIGRVGELPGNPLGRLPEDYYTLNELRFVNAYRLGEFRMKDGWFAEGGSRNFPMKELMETLYEKRTGSDVTRLVAKEIANQYIGKLVEGKVASEYGKIRNDLYHALITSQARVEVARFLVANAVKPDELVCVQTDGVKLTRDIPLEPNGMGTWVNKGTPPTIVFSPYKVYSADARPYRLTYSDVMDMIREHPMSQRYNKMIKHQLTMVQAIRQHEDVTKVGEIIDMPDSLDLVMLIEEQNRIYKKLPKTGQALVEGKYPSAPFIYD